MANDLAICLPTDRPLTPPTGTSRGLRDGDARHRTLISLVRRPWLVRVAEVDLVIRPIALGDLEALAEMHRRCSARSLLDRYRMGGRGPSVLALQRELRRPLSFVAAAPRGRAIVALASVTIDDHHGRASGRLGLLVQDDRHGQGIGRELITHLAGAAVVCGYNELVAYPATPSPAVRALMLELGHCRVVEDATHPHLHSALAPAAALGLGPVRERLAG